MNRTAFALIRGLFSILLLLTVSLVGCRGSEQPSNASLSDPSAEADSATDDASPAEDPEVAAVREQVNGFISSLTAGLERLTSSSEQSQDLQQPFSLSVTECSSGTLLFALEDDLIVLSDRDDPDSRTLLCFSGAGYALLQTAGQTTVLQSVTPFSSGSGGGFLSEMPSLLFEEGDLTATQMSGVCRIETEWFERIGFSEADPDSCSGTARVTEDGTFRVEATIGALILSAEQSADGKLTLIVKTADPKDAAGSLTPSLSITWEEQDAESGNGRTGMASFILKQGSEERVSVSAGYTTADGELLSLDVDGHIRPAEGGYLLVTLRYAADPGTETGTIACGVDYTSGDGELTGVWLEVSADQTAATGKLTFRQGVEKREYLFRANTDEEDDRRINAELTNSSDPNDTILLSIEPSAPGIALTERESDLLRGVRTYLADPAAVEAKAVEYSQAAIQRFSYINFQTDTPRYYYVEEDGIYYLTALTVSGVRLQQAQTWALFDITPYLSVAACHSGNFRELGPTPFTRSITQLQNDWKAFRERFRVDLAVNDYYIYRPIEEGGGYAALRMKAEEPIWLPTLPEGVVLLPITSADVDPMLFPGASVNYNNNCRATVSFDNGNFRLKSKDNLHGGPVQTLLDADLEHYGVTLTVCSRCGNCFYDFYDRDERHILRLGMRRLRLERADGIRADDIPNGVTVDPECNPWIVDLMDWSGSPIQSFNHPAIEIPPLPEEIGTLVAIVYCSGEWINTQSELLILPEGMLYVTDLHLIFGATVVRPSTLVVAYIGNNKWYGED